MSLAVRVVAADWTRDHDALAGIRRVVFIDEQGVPEALEWDEFDACSQHFLALVGDTPTGCARLLPDAHLGRMAVLPAYRRQGVGAALLTTLLAAAVQAGMREIRLSAQTHATGFYARAGFVAEGEVYDEAGIPHQAMRRVLTDSLPD